MASPLLNFINNLYERIHENKCKYAHSDKKCETCGITYCFPEYVNFKNDLIEYKCLCHNKKLSTKPL